jgi:hypothetical protein
MRAGVLESLLKIPSIGSAHTISLIPMYEKLSDEKFKAYFSKEISLYIAQ